MNQVETATPAVPPKRSEAEHAQLPNACHSVKARSAKEESAVLSRNWLRKRATQHPAMPGGQL